MDTSSRSRRALPLVLSIAIATVAAAPCAAAGGGPLDGLVDPSLLEVDLDDLVPVCGVTVQCTPQPPPPCLGLEDGYGTCIGIGNGCIGGSSPGNCLGASSTCIGAKEGTRCAGVSTRHECLGVSFWWGWWSCVGVHFGCTQALRWDCILAIS
jgi:hypothetical protein